MVFSLSTVSYLDIMKYMGISTGVIFLAFFMFSGYFLITYLLKKRIITRIYKQIYDGCMNRKKSRQLLGDVEEDEEEKYSYNAKLQMIYFLFDFFQTVFWSMVILTIVLELEKLCISSDDFMIYLNTILAFIIGSEFVSYYAKIVKRISYVFNPKIRIGDVIKIMNHKGKVVDIKSRYFVIHPILETDLSEEEAEECKEDELVLIQLNLLNTNTLTLYNKKLKDL